jgi:hypothetical protein
MDGMTPPPSSLSPKHSRRDKWDWLLRLIVVLTALLVPLCFYELFHVTTTLLYPYIGDRAWIVPAAVEGGFTISFLLDLWLQHKGKPQAWLRWVPYGFAVASLLIQVWAAHGVIPAMVANTAVTAAFFLPLIASERAVKSLAITDDEVKEMRERGDAMRYARDLMRDRKGIWWRWRVPSLLRVQILHARPPAAVLKAVQDGSRFGGATEWEPAVETWVAGALTRGDKMAVTVERQRRTIAASAVTSETAPAAASGSPRPARQPARQKAAEARARATQLLLANPDWTVAEVAKKAKTSASTVDRVKRELPVQLHRRTGT